MTGNLREISGSSSSRSQRRRMVVRCHHAEGLARDIELPEPGLFRYEYVFEHAIPEECLLRKASLETFMAHGLDWEKYFNQRESERPDEETLSTSTLRWYFAREFDDEHQDRHTIVNTFASAFGARAPAGWIARHLLADCASGPRRLRAEDLEITEKDFTHPRVLEQIARFERLGGY